MTRHGQALSQQAGVCGHGLVAMLVCGALAACAPLASRVGAAGAPDVPAGWAALSGATADPATSLAHWWLRFGDPTMSALVSQAMQANTSVALARSVLLQARASRRCWPVRPAWAMHGSRLPPKWR